MPATTATRFGLRLLALGWLGSMFLSACASDTSPPAPAKPKPKSHAADAGVVWSAPSDAQHFAAIWGSSKSDVWGVGENGRIVHFDGKAWSEVDGGTTQSLLGVHGSGPDDVWAVGDNVILRWDGETWSTALSDMQEVLLGVWVAAPDDAWMAGFTTDTGRGIVRHWDGDNWDWTELSSVGTVWEIWGSGPHDIWLGGSLRTGGGFLARGDGMNFDDPGYPGGSVRGIWGSSPDDVWIAPYEGSFQHWDGTGFSEFPVADGTHVLSVSGSSERDAWAVGVDGLVLHWDGGAWTPEDFESVTFLGVWAPSHDDAWIVGGDIARWNGTRWQGTMGK